MPGIRLDEWETGAPASKAPAKPSAETSQPLVPGQALFESGKRALGRGLRMRETQRALTKSYAAKTAQAARGFGDTANIAVVEREMMQSSFPQDGDTQEGRTVMEDSLLGGTGFFDIKEAELVKQIEQTAPMILKGISKSGPRFEADPAILAQKRQAATDLARLRQTRILYQQMFDEAREKMPPIGTGQPSPSQGGREMVDAQGNRALVYPDGRIEELP